MAALHSTQTVSLQCPNAARTRGKSGSNPRESMFDRCLSSYAMHHWRKQPTPLLEPWRIFGFVQCSTALHLESRSTPSHQFLQVCLSFKVNKDCSTVSEDRYALLFVCATASIWISDPGLSIQRQTNGPCIYSTAHVGSCTLRGAVMCLGPRPAMDPEEEDHGTPPSSPTPSIHKPATDRILITIIQ